MPKIKELEKGYFKDENIIFSIFRDLISKSNKLIL